MSTIKGIFEPFAGYVTKQLRIRKSILINRKSFQLEEDENFNPDMTGLNELSQGTYEFGQDTAVNTTENDDNPPTGTIGEITVVGQSLNFEDRIDLSARHELFSTITTERQCVIRMASGVDIKEKNNILEETEGYLTGDNLAYNWVLEGGIKSIGGNRGGISEGQFSTAKGFAYGDMNLRADADDGFGIVPMPGILDATINTKSEDGSLREATVNFVCHNQRQLEVLETLYMRPGYPIMLEWGWVPYINNDLIVKNNGFSILEEFFQKDSTFDKINFAIKDQKIASGGNYDGFVGYCKNFMFKAREDGGYNCTTEIIAQGEILESLKTKSKTVPKLPKFGDYEYDVETGLYNIQRENETVDNFLYYLKSIKSNLDQAGIEATLKYIGTDNSRLGSLTDGGIYDSEFLARDSQESSVSPLDVNSYFTSGSTLPTKIKSIESTGGGTLDNETIQEDYILRNINNQSEYSFRYFEDNDGNIIPIHQLNVVSTDYVKGISEIEEMISDITKVSEGDLEAQRKAFKKAPAFLTNTPLNKYGNRRGNGDIRDKNNTKGATMRNVEGLGFGTLYEGTILKEFSLEDESDNDSGIRKKIFLRWDLICQIFNRLIIPEYKENQPIVELSYLTKDSPTYKEGTPPDKPNEKHDKDGIGYYIPYSQEHMNTILPLDEIGLNDTYLGLILDNREEEDGDVIIKSSELDAYITSISIQNVGISHPQYSHAKASSNAFVQKYGDNALVNISTGEITFPPILGRSYDRNVCIMPHQLPQMTEMDPVATENTILRRSLGEKNFTSYKGVIAEANSIGHVYFNLDYLINTYESLSLEEFKTTNSLGEERNKRRLKKKFSIHDWITTIWNDANDACGGYYDFGLHTEHERPNIARIIDFTMSGGSKDILKKIFTFDPQGLQSTTRDNHFQSKLDNDFAAVISIAAQAPNDINSLEAVSFKAFHKGIKNRFTDDEKNGRMEDESFIDESLKEYKQDFEDYEGSIRSILLYINRMNQSNYESTVIPKSVSSDAYLQRPLSPSSIKTMAAGLEAQRISLLNRYPEVDPQGRRHDITHPEGHYTGQYRDDLSSKGAVTYNRNAIIPLTSTLTLDGISGIHPLNIYKINSNRLPTGYQDPNIVFVVKKELHKITSGQDWTVDIEGNLTLLNDNPSTGTNPTLTVRPPEDNPLNEVDEGFNEWVEYIRTYYWSAVFISWCVKEAERSASVNNFEPFSSHTGYFEKNKETEHFEHLDPKTTPIEPGDLCLRYNPDSKTSYPGPYSGGSHADIVVKIDEEYAYLVGGNVSSKKHINAGLYTSNDGLIVGEKKTPINPDTFVYITAKLAESSKYYKGSILRAKSKEVGLFIALIADSEQRNWPTKNGMPLIETDSEVEDIIRKYISVYPPKCIKDGGDYPCK